MSYGNNNMNNSSNMNKVSLQWLRSGPDCQNAANDMQRRQDIVFVEVNSRNRGEDSFFYALSKSRSVLALRFTSFAGTDASTNAFCDVIVNNPTIRTVEIGMPASANDMESLRGVANVIRSLERNNNITTLRFENFPFRHSSDCMSYLSEYIKNAHSLLHLAFYNCAMSVQDMQNLTKGLKFNKSVRVVRFDQNTARYAKPDIKQSFFEGVNDRSSRLSLRIGSEMSSFGRVESDNREEDWEVSDFVEFRGNDDRWKFGHIIAMNRTHYDIWSFVNTYGSEFIGQIESVSRQNIRTSRFPHPDTMYELQDRYQARDGNDNYGSGMRNHGNHGNMKYRVGDNIDVRFYGDPMWYKGRIIGYPDGQESIMESNMHMYDVEMEDDNSVEPLVEYLMIRPRSDRIPTDVSIYDSGIYQRGDYVEMRLANGIWRRARVAIDKKNGTYDVRMEDGSDHKGVAGRWLRHHFRPNEKADVRQWNAYRAMNNNNNGGNNSSRRRSCEWRPARIMNQDRDGGYIVVYEDDNSEESGIHPRRLMLPGRDSIRYNAYANNEQFREMAITSANNRFSVNDRVSVRQNDGSWNSGRVEAIQRDGSYTVRFLDGSVEVGILEHRVQDMSGSSGSMSPSRDSPRRYNDRDDFLANNVNNFREGSRVEAIPRGRRDYMPAVVVRHRQDNDTFDIRFDDGSEEFGVIRTQIRSMDSSTQYNNRPQSAFPTSNAFSVGSQVEAMSRSGRWNQGTVVNERPNGLYDVRMQSGETEMGIEAYNIRSLNGNRNYGNNDSYGNYNNNNYNNSNYSNNEYASNNSYTNSNSPFTEGMRVQFRGPEMRDYGYGSIDRINRNGSVDIRSESGELYYRIDPKDVKSMDGNNMNPSNGRYNSYDGQQQQQQGYDNNNSRYDRRSPNKDAEEYRQMRSPRREIMQAQEMYGNNDRWEKGSSRGYDDRSDYRQRGKEYAHTVNDVFPENMFDWQGVHGSANQFAKAGVGAFYESDITNSQWFPAIAYIYPYKIFNDENFESSSWTMSDNGYLPKGTQFTIVPASNSYLEFYGGQNASGRIVWTGETSSCVFFVKPTNDSPTEISQRFHFYLQSIIVGEVILNFRVSRGSSRNMDSKRTFSGKHARSPFFSNVSIVMQENEYESRQLGNTPAKDDNTIFDTLSIAAMNAMPSLRVIRNDPRSGKLPVTSIESSDRVQFINSYPTNSSDMSPSFMFSMSLFRNDSHRMQYTLATTAEARVLNNVPQALFHSRSFSPEWNFYRWMLDNHRASQGPQDMRVFEMKHRIYEALHGLYGRMHSFSDRFVPLGMFALPTNLAMNGNYQGSNGSNNNNNGYNNNNYSNSNNNNNGYNNNSNGYNNNNNNNNWNSNNNSNSNSNSINGFPEFITKASIQDFWRQFVGANGNTANVMWRLFFFCEDYMMNYKYDSSLDSNSNSNSNSNGFSDNFCVFENCYQSPSNNNNNGYGNQYGNQQYGNNNSNYNSNDFSQNNRSKSNIRKYFVDVNSDPRFFMEFVPSFKHTLAFMMAYKYFQQEGIAWNFPFAFNMYYTVQRMSFDVLVELYNMFDALHFQAEHMFVASRFSNQGINYSYFANNRRNSFVPNDSFDPMTNVCYALEDALVSSHTRGNYSMSYRSRAMRLYLDRFVPDWEQSIAFKTYLLNDSIYWISREVHEQYWRTLHELVQGFHMTGTRQMGPINTPWSVHGLPFHPENLIILDFMSMWPSGFGSSSGSRFPMKEFNNAHKELAAEFQTRFMSEIGVLDPELSLESSMRLIRGGIDSWDDVLRLHEILPLPSPQQNGSSPGGSRLMRDVNSDWEYIKNSLTMAINKHFGISMIVAGKLSSYVMKSNNNGGKGDSFGRRKY